MKGWFCLNKRRRYNQGLHQRTKQVDGESEKTGQQQTLDLHSRFGFSITFGTNIVEIYSFSIFGCEL